MAAPLEVNVCRKNLADNIGPESMAQYLQLLKSWFKTKISKEDFDSEARKFLKSDSMHLHNDFLLAIVSKCLTVTSLVPKDIPQHSLLLPLTKSPKKSGSNKLKRKLPSSRSNVQKFTPLCPLQYAPVVSPRPVEEGGNFISFVSRESLLPELGMLKGRVLVTAWELGLQDVQDLAVRLIIKAVEKQLKVILDTTLSHMRAYKLREKKFRFAHSCERPNPYLRQSALIEDPSSEGEVTGLTSSGTQMPCFKMTSDMAEQSALHQISAAGRGPPRRQAITLFEMLEALQVDKSVTPSNCVYEPLMERIIQKMWHPSNEEMDQESIAAQETALRQELS